MVGAERVRFVASGRAAARESGHTGDGGMRPAEAGRIAELLAQRGKTLAAVNRTRNRRCTKLLVPIRDHKCQWAGFDPLSFLVTGGSLVGNLRSAAGEAPAGSSTKNRRGSFFARRETGTASDAPFRRSLPFGEPFLASESVQASAIPKGGRIWWGSVAELLARESKRLATVNRHKSGNSHNSALSAFSDRVLRGGAKPPLDVSHSMDPAQPSSLGGVPFRKPERAPNPPERRSSSENVGDCAIFGDFGEDGADLRSRHTGLPQRFSGRTARTKPI